MIQTIMYIFPIKYVGNVSFPALYVLDFWKYYKNQTHCDLVWAVKPTGIFYSWQSEWWNNSDVFFVQECCLSIKIISENKTNCSSSSDEVSFFYFKSLSNNYLDLTFIRATTKRLTLSFGKHSVSLYFASSNWLVFDGHISNFNYSLPQLHCIFYTHLLRS